MDSLFYILFFSFAKQTLFIARREIGKSSETQKQTETVNVQFRLI